jgi:uncharacterized membrane protein
LQLKNLTKASKDMITKVAIGVIIFLATMVAIYSLFLLVVGQPWSVAYEANMRQQVEYVRATQAIVPFLSIMVLGGLVLKSELSPGEL